MRARPFRFRVLIAAILIPMYITGCASSPPAPVSDALSESGAASGISGSQDIKQALYGQLDQWRGTKYRLGGISHKGIDCSGLTYVVYRDLFNKQLPRTTEEQGEVGRGVKRRALAPGDLVFFKTGIFRKHVGIYVEKGLFIHASKSGGVRVSSLGDEYWRKRYWKARRLGI